MIWPNYMSHPDSTKIYGENEIGIPNYDQEIERQHEPAPTPVDAPEPEDYERSEMTDQ